ncbi:MAG: VWA domain-containing protein [Deltaproteobacteria bacterium]|nr:VWA domain-containing protein [Deltaproteobacteria bacterium]
MTTQRLHTTLKGAVRLGGICGAAMLLALACGDPSDTRPGATSIGVTFNPTTGPSNVTEGDSEDDTAGVIPDIGSADTGPPGNTDGGCAEVSDTAEVGAQPADILIVIDNSGSMSFEASSVQLSMNSFSSQIILANIDAHVAIISADISDDAGVCVPQPLGSGNCPVDDNPPGYLHIVDSVGSNNALQKILDHYGAWSAVFRPTAAKHVLVVSDDDSDLGAAAFDQAFRALDPTLADYTFHAIASPEDEILACIAGTSCCLLAAALSQEYIDLVNMTGGVFGNLCDQDFQPVFDQLSTAVIQGATLACEYPIPPPPDGMDFNPDQVNVEFDDGMGGVLEIGRVDSAADCAGVNDGWYYDDPVNPTTIVVCPQTCDQIQGFAGASVSIKFGCATVPAG